MNVPPEYDPSVLNRADITAIVLVFIALPLYMIGAARDSMTVMLIGLVIMLPATILKVGSSRAKSRRWHQYIASRGKAREDDAAK
ncbi:MAG TPA: hypothetical protein VF541_13770 [Longimicrobium sp.]|jgi:hypothetical protein